MLKTLRGASGFSHISSPRDSGRRFDKEAIVFRMHLLILLAIGWQWAERCFGGG